MGVQTSHPLQLRLQRGVPKMGTAVSRLQSNAPPSDLNITNLHSYCFRTQATLYSAFKSSPPTTPYII